MSAHGWGLFAAAIADLIAFALVWCWTDNERAIGTEQGGAP